MEESSNICRFMYVCTVSVPVHSGQPINGWYTEYAHSNAAYIIKKASFCFSKSTALPTVRTCTYEYSY